MPLELSDSARSLLRLRYLRRDEEGRIIETEEELFGASHERSLLQRMPFREAHAVRRLPKSSTN